MPIQDTHFQTKEFILAASGHIVARRSFASERNGDPVSFCRDCVILSRETWQGVTPFLQLSQLASQKAL